MDDVKNNVKEVFTKLEDTFGSISSKLIPAEEPKTDRDLIRYVVKAMAMEACVKQYAALTECMKKSWFSTCSKKQTEYWECYRKETIRLRKHYDVYWDN
ncbi:hypothetical protein ACROYT_G038251 [Oculina patagonica]